MAIQTSHPTLQQRLTSAAKRSIQTYAEARHIDILHPQASDTFVVSLSTVPLEPHERAQVALPPYLYSASAVEVSISLDDQGHEWRIEVALLAPSACWGPQGVAGVEQEEALTPHHCRKRLGTVIGEGLGADDAAYAIGVSACIAPLVSLLYGFLITSLRVRCG